ncbi:hypothetical protein [Acinetobacter amyesii]|uniref:hypothetical protein n=1 Tax=Acinetobacter amyesii TaxID=2942470 RepID=UPI0020BF508C|nr:hypothetical protein [Acinetobacter amyesii]MCL6231356.1 hypothetical protein [Acinetobacter amyesii]
MSNSNLLKTTSDPLFWRQWLQLMALCSALVLSPTFLYLVYLHGADGAIIVLLMMITLFFLSYLLVYMLFGLLLVGGMCFWLITKYPQHVSAVQCGIVILIALIWIIGISGFAFDFIPYNVAQRAYF